MLHWIFSRNFREMSSTRQIAFIGGGNMAGGLIHSIIKKGYSPNNIIVGEPNQERAQYLHDKYGIRTTHDNKEVVKSADVVVLAVKPQMTAHICEGIKCEVQTNKPLVLSILTG